MGEAKAYVRRIYEEFADAGFALCHTLVDGQFMGVPQHRERVFFTAIRNDLLQYIPSYDTLFETVPMIDLNFQEQPIFFDEFYMPGVDDRPSSKGQMKKYWEKRKPEDADLRNTVLREWGENKCFSNRYLKLGEVSSTLTANNDCLFLYEEYRKPNREEVCCISSFPQDYDFMKEPYYYICGMSVPPVMMAQVASRVYEQWLTKIPN